MACRPVLIHAMVMSIIFEHYKQLSKIVFDNWRDWWGGRLIALCDEQETTNCPTSRA